MCFLLRQALAIFYSLSFSCSLPSPMDTFQQECPRPQGNHPHRRAIFFRSDDRKWHELPFCLLRSNDPAGMVSE